MSYETAPATRMLATDCAICGRPLLDALSVETGIGPTCRKRCGYTAEMNALTEDARHAANALIYNCALNRTPDNVIESVIKLMALGAPRVADAIVRGVAAVKIANEADRLAVETPYSEIAVAQFRAVPGRRWDPERKLNTFPAASRAPLFAALQACFPGSIAIGPKGPFRI
jgi:hypothetical protein